MKKKHSTPGTPSAPSSSRAPRAPKPARRWGLKPRTALWLTYVLGFAALFAFLYEVYGDVLTRTEQDSYISTSPDTMHYLLSQPYV